MEVGYVANELAALDGSGADVIACGLFEDERPMRGLAAVADFRLAGRLSAYLRRGELTGVMGEAFLFPPRPRLSAEKLVVFGWGPSTGLDEAACERAIRRIVIALVGLGAKRTVLELPGRARGLCDPERAASLLFRVTEEHAADLSVLLVEDEPGRKRFALRFEEEKKRARRVL